MIVLNFTHLVMHFSI